jgi:hypothetical protein
MMEQMMAMMMMGDMMSMGVDDEDMEDFDFGMGMKMPK